VAKRRETFASRLTDIRKAAGITKYRLAQLSGLSKQALTRLESGQGEPTWGTVQLLAKALGVSCEAFVTEDVQPPEPPPVKRPGPKKKGTGAG
jgi:transcriptional regulator with XRE-family HTH domain